MLACQEFISPVIFVRDKNHLHTTLVAIIIPYVDQNIHSIVQ